MESGNVVVIVIVLLVIVIVGSIFRGFKRKIRRKTRPSSIFRLRKRF